MLNIGVASFFRWKAVIFFVTKYVCVSWMFFGRNRIKTELLSLTPSCITSHCFMFYSVCESSFFGAFIFPGLWGLVNNAGVWCFAELEMTSESIVQKVMDVNLFGAVRVTKSVLPLIKQAHGRIVNVSSLLGKM